MALLDDVADILARLAPRGWRKLLKDVTDDDLDIGAAEAKLENELTKPLGTIRRMTPGFREFASEGKHAVTPGRPGESLLYHALASADVRPERNGKPSLNPDDYPTLEDLDTIENYIYSRALVAVSSFTRPVLAVFAYQYRSLGFTTHREHADIAFSRTGVARVGTEAHEYDPILRCYEPRPSGDRCCHVLPARYAAFIAEERTPSADDSVMRAVSVDANLPFLFPRHKVFAGDECLFADDGTPLNLNGEVPRVPHQRSSGGCTGKKTPAIRSHSRLRPRRAAVPAQQQQQQRSGHPEAPWIVDLVVSKPAKLVRTAKQTVKGKPSIAAFIVPKEKKNGENRFWTSLSLEFPPAQRAAPEYANIRQEVVSRRRRRSVVDLNLIPLQPPRGQPTFASKLRQAASAPPTSSTRPARARSR
jgi:hypothetical protein